ncbi:general substrate transporter [Talaromyces proteolyticus]|uniref:General substrate transporter n=1 Tax=Talaromyces proteolyticus TaxID=1131652 RepID=A0AAD4PXW8_9EURO|nr:general substrate transporter [Talaromyces proteolyticus]KAH8697109.1 general substrate transporter [Talaromyces proteolyticus]
MGRGTTAGTAVFLAIGGFLFGYDSGIISSTIVQPYFEKYMGTPTSSQTGGIVSSFTGGAIPGALSVAWLPDRVGRRMTVFIGACISVLGCALQGGASNIPMMIAGRFIAGVAVGLLSAVVPMYCSEIAISQDRGKLSGLLQWMLSWGFLVAQWLGYGCFKVNSDFQWRFPLAFQVVPGTIIACGIWFLQESPRWLIEKDRHEDARAVLTKLHGNGSNDEFLELEYCEIRDAIVAEKTVSVQTWTALMAKPSWRKRLALGCGVQAFGQLSGINVINYYGNVIYQILGIDTGTSLMIVGISGALSIVYCTAGLYLLDKVGRVKPLIFSATGMALALVVNAVLSQYYVVKSGAQTSDGNALRAMVAMNLVFSLFFTFTGIISWVYPAEIFPIEIRAKGNSISTITNWSLNLLFAQCAPIALSSLGFRFFYFFFAFNIVATVCYIFLFPETKGKTLEQMDELFGDQLVPHALEDPEGAAAVMSEKFQHATHVEMREE